MAAPRLAYTLAGVAGAFAAMAAGGLAIVEWGLFDATASRPHLAPVAWATHTAFIRSVEVRAPASPMPPARFTPQEMRAGFADYDASCAVCHGGPGVSRAPWVQGMNPAPPYLNDSARRWRPRELYWIIGQGAKMTAMPAWAETRSEGQLWNLVAFLEALPYLTADDYARLRAARASDKTPTPR